MSQKFESEKILNLNVDCVTQEDALAWILGNQTGNGFKYLVTPNAAHYVTAYDSPDIAELYHDAGLCVNDSRVVAVLMRLFGKSISVVTGSDLTAKLFHHLDEHGGALSLIGMGSEYLPTLQARFPNITIRHLDPPHPFFDDPQTLNPVLDWIEAQPHGIYIFGVGAPQQERLARRILHRSKAQGVGLCIGGSVEFLVGAQTRAPVVFQKLNLEWLHRLASNPRRMWRRYLITSPRFFAYAVQETLGWRRNHDRSPVRSNES